MFKKLKEGHVSRTQRMRGSKWEMRQDQTKLRLEGHGESFSIYPKNSEKKWRHDKI